MDETTAIELITTQPERYRRLSNGAIYDNEKGRITGNPNGGKTAITQARSSELHKIRKEKAIRAIHSGMAKAKGRTATKYEAIEAMARNITVIAMEERSRTAVLAFRELLKAGDFIRPDKENEPDNGVSIHIGADVARELLNILHGNR